LVKYWEDYNIGDKFVSPGRTLTEDMISVLIGLGGYNLSFFWDEEFGKRTLWGGRVVPGPLILFLMFGQEQQAGAWDDETIMYVLGINKATFKTLVRPGDTLTTQVEIIDKRETKRLDRGIIFHRDVCWNQKGEEVAMVEVAHMIKRRL
jgi:acyl dehydratase